ncbi:MAG: hypothetical protein K0Q73_8372, partial [Paenibacillus sp.]|nr:hypothetical protein [Paenibacillus sp.]
MQKRPIGPFSFGDITDFQKNSADFLKINIPIRIKMKSYSETTSGGRKNMIRTRGILASMMSVALLGSVLTACSTGNDKSSESTGSKTDGASGKVEKVVIALPSFNKIPDDMSSINDAINKITTKKINVQVDFKVYGPADYGQKVNLALQSGE